MKKVMTATETMEAVPNYYPTCYIGYVDEIIPSKKIIATRDMTINEKLFRGRLPGSPIMPDVSIIEALVRVGSILVLKTDQLEGETTYVGGTNKARLRRKVAPGDVLKLHFEIVKLRDFIGIGKTTVCVGSKKIYGCELMFIVGR